MSYCTKTVQALRERVSYNPTTGSLRWLPRAPSSFKGERYPKERQAAVFNCAYAGKEALNCPTGTGHLMGTFDGRPMKAHHAAWMIHYGCPPPVQIDHINGDGSDNRIANLRAANASINAKNRKTPRHNSSGIMGVYLRSDNGKWVATIGSRPKIYLGQFDTLEAAAHARAAAMRKFDYHPNHGRKPLRAGI